MSLGRASAENNVRAKTGLPPGCCGLNGTEPTVHDHVSNKRLVHVLTQRWRFEQGASPARPGAGRAPCSLRRWAGHLAWPHLALPCAGPRRTASPGTCASPAAPSPRRVRSSLQPNGRISKLPGENRRSAASHQVNRCNIMTRQKCFSVRHIPGIDSSCVCLVFVPSSWLEAPQTLGSPEN